MRGDLLLYKSGGSFRDRVVVWFTRGPFVHAEVDLGDGTSIGARSEDGVSHHKRDLFDRVIEVSVQERTSQDRIEAGIEWLMGHVGEPFSWASILDHALPQRLSSWLFGRRSLYSCGNLIANYLTITGAFDLPYGKNPPMIISPNDIAKAVGLL